MSDGPYRLFRHLSSISLLNPISFGPLDNPSLMLILSLFLPKKLFPVLFHFLHPDSIFLGVWLLKPQLLQENLNEGLSSLEHSVIVTDENVGVVFVV